MTEIQLPGSTIGRATAIGESTNGTGLYTATFGYNANDLPITATLGNGVQQSAQYDPASRLTQLTTSGASGLSPSTYSYGYNALGWTTSDATPYSGTDTITHDPATGRLQSESGPNVTTPSHSYAWSYDGNGNVTQSSADNGQPEVFSYSPGSTLNKLLQTHAAGYSQPDTRSGLRDWVRGARRLSVHRGLCPRCRSRTVRVAGGRRLLALRPVILS